MTDIHSQIKTAITAAENRRDNGGALHQDDRTTLVKMQTDLAEKIREMMKLNEVLMNVIRPQARL